MKKKIVFLSFLFFLTCSIVFSAKPLDEKLQGYYFMALYYYQNSNYDKANKYFDKALTIEPNLVDAYYIKAHMFLEEGNKEKGLELFNFILNMKEKVFISVDVEEADVAGEIKQIKDEEKKKLEEEKKKKKKEEEQKKKAKNKKEQTTEIIIKTKPASITILAKNKIKLFLGELDGIKVADKISFKILDPKIAKEFVKNSPVILTGKVEEVNKFYSLIATDEIFTETSKTPLNIEIIEEQEK